MGKKNPTVPSLSTGKNKKKIQERTHWILWSLSQVVYSGGQRSYCAMGKFSDTFCPKGQHESNGKQTISSGSDPCELAHVYHMAIVTLRHIEQDRQQVAENCWSSVEVGQEADRTVPGSIPPFMIMWVSHSFECTPSMCTHLGPGL